MIMKNTIKFNLADDNLESQIRDHLAKKYPMKKEAAIIGRLAYYDTFDWRLFNKSHVLYTFQDRSILRKLRKDRIIHSLNTKPVPCFIWDFPEGDLKRYLEPIIKMRKLLKLVDLNSRITPYRILNRDEKTVARLCFETIRTRSRKDSKTIGARLWLKSIKGYTKYSNSVKNQLESIGLTSSRDEEVFSHAMREAGCDPGSYSAKLRIQLSPDMRADEATIKIWRFLFQVIKVNEAHIKHDIDTEILHDFRVAIRRTRSALVWDKNLLSEKTNARFKRNLSYVGKISNELRDLDVYLLKKPEYKALLPTVLCDDIDPLFDYLSKQRSVSFRKVIRILNSKKYRRIMQDWESFLDEPQYDLIWGPSAKVPVFRLACKRIYKQYRNVVKAGNRILLDCKDEELHKLRIQCKKLRYLIQFFADLFPPKKISLLVGQLKKLQDMLGSHNDLSVQVNYLFEVAQEMPANLSRLNKTLVAIGSLIGKLETKRQSVKESFAETFTRFSSPQNQKLFRELFAPQSKKVVS
jgi:CHAD domain-containing protein